MIKLPTLPYAFDALEPYIDSETLEIHYTKHHQAYIDKLNAVLEKYPSLASPPLEESLANLDNLPLDPKDKIIFKNNAGGHLNHSFFWSILSPQKEIDSNLVDRINQKFGSIQNFKDQFTQTALSHFGSGWAWLSENQSHDLELYSLPNQDSTRLLGHIPLIGIDLWEHAYYLKYQNRRAEYITAWYSVLKLID